MTSMLVKDRWSLVFIFIILIMGAEIVYLVRQNRELRAIIENPRDHLETLKENEVVPPFTGTDVYGNEVAFTFGDGAPYTVLFWMSPHCSVCKENLTFWSHLYDEYNGEKVRFVGFCDAGAADALTYAEDNNLPFPVVAADKREMVETYKGDALPQTVLIGPVGAIAKVWPGSLARVREEQILSILRQIDTQPSQEGGEN